MLPKIVVLRALAITPLLMLSALAASAQDVVPVHSSAAQRSNISRCNRVGRREERGRPPQQWSCSLAATGSCSNRMDRLPRG